MGAAGATQLANALELNSTLTELKGFFLLHTFHYEVLCFHCHDFDVLLYINAKGDFGSEEARISRLLDAQARAQRQVSSDILIVCDCMHLCAKAFHNRQHPNQRPNPHPQQQWQVQSHGRS